MTMTMKSPKLSLSYQFFSRQTRTLVGIVCGLLLWAQASLVPRRRSTARIECHQPKYALIALKS